MSVKHIVNLSGGNASACALFRVLERFGAESLSVCFADVLVEDADVYRFIDDVERAAGVDVVRLVHGMTKWEVFHDRAMITAPKETGGGCLASWVLKKQMLKSHAEQVGNPDETVIYVGLGPDEDSRQARLVKNGGPWKYDFPLCWPERMWRCDLDKDLKRRGLKPPASYAQGYPHANCAGACVLAGIKQWSGLLKDNPALYATEEAEEQKFLATLDERGRKPMTILKDRRGGEARSLSLKQLREEIAQGIRHHDDSWRETSCSCMLF